MLPDLKQHSPPRLPPRIFPPELIHALAPTSYHMVWLSGQRFRRAGDENHPDLSYRWNDASVESAKVEISQERLVSIFLLSPLP